jgi:hypothetical protein
MPRRTRGSERRTNEGATSRRRDGGAGPRRPSTQSRAIVLIGGGLAIALAPTNSGPAAVCWLSHARAPASSRLGNQEHFEGHVAEWLWCLLMREHASGARKIVLLEPPKFSP